MTRRRKILYALVAILLPLLLVEGILRLVGFSYEERVVSLDFVGITNTDRETRRNLHLDPDLFWSIAPHANLSMSNGGVFERANALGLRGYEVDRTKPDGVRRVAVVGDSCTFGFGVELARTWPFELERRLRASGSQVEVVNGGVPGYSTYQCRERLRRDLLPLEPDVVVLYAGQWNDFVPAVGAPDHEKAAAAESSALPADLTNDFGGLRLFQAVAWASVEVRDEIRKGRSALITSDFQGGQPADNPRVPVDRFVENLEAVARMARERGIPVFFVPGPVPRSTEERFPDVNRYREVLRETARRLGVRVVPVDAALRAHDEGVFRDWVHPSPLGHRVIAERLFETLCREELLGLEAGDAQADLSPDPLRRPLDADHWQVELRGTASAIESGRGPIRLSMTVPGEAVFEGRLRGPRATFHTRLQAPPGVRIRADLVREDGAWDRLLDFTTPWRRRGIAYLGGRAGDAVRLVLAALPAEDAPNAASGAEPRVEWVGPAVVELR